MGNFLINNPIFTMSLIVLAFVLVIWDFFRRKKIQNIDTNKTSTKVVSGIGTFIFVSLGVIGIILNIIYFFEFDSRHFSLSLLMGLFVSVMFIFTGVKGMKN